MDYISEAVVVLFVLDHIRPHSLLLDEKEHLGHSAKLLLCSTDKSHTGLTQHEADHFSFGRTTFIHMHK